MCEKLYTWNSIHSVSISYRSSNAHRVFFSAINFVVVIVSVVLCVCRFYRPNNKEKPRMKGNAVRIACELNLLDYYIYDMITDVLFHLNDFISWDKLAAFIKYLVVETTPITVLPVVDIFFPQIYLVWFFNRLLFELYKQCICFIVSHLNFYYCFSVRTKYRWPLV